LVDGHSNLKMVPVKPNVAVNLVYSDSMGKDHMINGNDALNVMTSGGKRNSEFVIETLDNSKGLIEKG